MPSKVKRDTPRPFTITGAGPTRVKAAEGEGKSKKLPTFEGVAYTGAPMRPSGWYGEIVLDLDGIRIPKPQRPILRQHDHEKIVGHSTEVKASRDGITVAGVLSNTDSPHAQEIVTLAGNGFEWQMSVGANPIRTEFLEAGETAEVNGREITGPITISRETELGEISFVPLGADGDTSARVSASKGGRMNARAMLKASGKYSDEQIDKMSDDEAKSALKECMKAEGDEDKKTEAEDEKKTEAEEEKKDEAKAKARAEDEDKKAEARITRAIEAATAKGIEAARKANAAEQARIAEIKARVARHGVTACEIEVNGKKSKVGDLAAHAIAAGWTANDAELHALRAGRPAPGPIVYGTTTPEHSEAVVECAMLQAAGCELFDSDFYERKRGERDGGMRPRDANRIKAELKDRYPEQVQDAAHKLYKGRIGLQEALTTIAASNGYRGPQTISMGNLGEVAQYASQVRADGSSTLSVANITANVMNKFLLQGYMYTEQAWKEICGIRSVKDFKATKSINLFGDVEFADVGPSGELKNATLQDQAFANQVATSGRIMTIPRTVIINDDLGALGAVPMMMGRGAGLKLNKEFWTRWLDANQKDDGGSTAFWAATHTIPNQKGNSNLSSGGGSALSSAGLTAAVLLFDKQVDPKGYPLGLDAEILLYPPDLQTTALELMNSQYIVQSAGATTKQPSDNIWKGRFRPVKSRYLSNADFTGYSAAAWYLLGNPSLVPCIEVAFLNGAEMPTVQQAGPDFQFNVLGITTRAFFDIGVTMQNFRGGVKSAGS